MLQIEIVLFLLLFLVGSRVLPVRLLRAVERSWMRLASRKGLSILLVFVAALAMRLALLRDFPVPTPTFHDEFSYLLAADTFAHGRLTNPTHPLWPAFVSMHELQVPTYMSKFPPAQGMFLALGQLLTGHPWAGVLLSCALMCAALCWMLQGWMPPRWALLGGLLAAIRLASMSYWINSYWGGAVSAMAGALVLGALPRLLRRPRASQALVMAAGLALLANSRPYEGFVLGVSALVLLFVGLRRRRIAPRPAFTSVILPMALLLAAVSAWMAYYFWRGTGSPFRMPYQVYQSVYDSAPLFLFGRPEPHATYPNAQFRDLYSFEVDEFHRSLTFNWQVLRYLSLWSFFLGPILTLPLVMIGAVFRDRRMRPLLILACVMLVAIGVEAYSQPHYAAPATGILYALVLQCMRHLAVVPSRRNSQGRWAVVSVPATAVLLLGMIAIWPDIRLFNVILELKQTWCLRMVNRDRAPSARYLEKQPGRHLVIVRYSSQHITHSEWVYNDADIDASRIVWARDVSPELTERVIRYYPDRRVWLLHPDAVEASPMPYPGAAQPPAKASP